MRYIIDEVICSKKGISVPEILSLLLVKSGVDIPRLFQNMEQKELLVKDMFGNYLVTQHWDDICCDTLLTAEKEIPKEDSLDTLATALMAEFPTGKKEGTISTYWRGNLKDTKLRLKKFFKLYGSKYTNEEIINATKAYVKSFNGDYSYMRVLKYFIWKDEKKVNSEGKSYIEEVSDLATFIENAGQEDFRNTEWATNLVCQD